MGWASGHIEKLKAGETVRFRPRGNSMSPRVESGDLCTVSPLSEDPAVGDVVLCTVGGRQYLHLVGAVAGRRFRIENRKGFVNGWVGREQIHGRLTKVGE